MANYDPNYGRESEKFQKKFKLNIPPILTENQDVLYEITSPILTDTKAENTTFKNDPPYIKLGTDDLLITSPILQNNISELNVTKPIVKIGKNEFSYNSSVLRTLKNNDNFSYSLPQMSSKSSSTSLSYSTARMRKQGKDRLHHKIPASVRRSSGGKFYWKTPKMTANSKGSLSFTGPRIINKDQGKLVKNLPKIARGSSSLKTAEPHLSRGTDIFEMEEDIENFKLIGGNLEGTTLEMSEPVIDIRPDVLERSDPLIDLRESILQNPTPSILLKPTIFEHANPDIDFRTSVLEHNQIVELSREFELIHNSPEFIKELIILFILPEPLLMIKPDIFEITEPELEEQ